MVSQEKSWFFQIKQEFLPGDASVMVFCVCFEFCDGLGSLRVFICMMGSHKKYEFTNAYVCGWTLGIEWETFNYIDLDRVGEDDLVIWFLKYNHELITFWLD